VEYVTPPGLRRLQVLLYVVHDDVGRLSNDCAVDCDVRRCAPLSMWRGRQALIRAGEITRIDDAGLFKAVNPDIDRRWARFRAAGKATYRGCRVDPGKSTADAVVPVQEGRALASPRSGGIEIKAERVVNGVSFGEVEGNPICREDGCPFSIHGACPTSN
jgi:hypothetical protein